MGFGQRLLQQSWNGHEADANAARQRVTENGGPEPLSPSIDRNYSSYQGTISASWELDIWGKLRRQSEAARAEVLASEEGRRAVVLTLAYRLEF